ncbi:hypothetical protein BD410DRAFT_731489 [Rickenella mellea]|uniref:Fungal-type protein kinase domain-containing protein n=1 Tax=Rickenella mellea TaxID=50990 RepID=A0A4Y7PLQ4_9AGAM|nr:hypothetical protein BD410DRAFT_731489 [Rickenella mellea]
MVKEKTLKYGRVWNRKELVACKIRFDSADASTFFRMTQLPQLTLSPIILNNIDKPDEPLEMEVGLYFVYMKGAMELGQSWSVVWDFLEFMLLRVFSYAFPFRTLVRRPEMSFIMNGKEIVVRDTIVLKLLKEGEYVFVAEMHGNPTVDHEPKLIARALAALTHNNQKRASRGLPNLRSQTFCGILITGTAPVFYQIPITQDLLSAIAAGKRPKDVTVVRKFTPPVENPAAYIQKGMIPLDNRRIILQCFAAFKDLLVRHIPHGHCPVLTIILKA